MSTHRVKLLDTRRSPLKVSSLSGHRLHGYRFGNVIGEGGCAFVYSATKSHSLKDIACIRSCTLDTEDVTGNDTIVAAKVSKRPFRQQCSQEQKSWMSELDILSSVNHPNIIACIEFFQMREHVVLVTELVDGIDLFDMISKSDSISVNARSLVCQVLEGLDYLHDQSIAHMDLKVENVLVDRNGKVALCDFGSAVRIPPCGNIRTHGIATPSSLPPEFFLRNFCNPRACDIWSVGVIMYLMLVQKYPYGNGEPEVISMSEYRQSLDFSGIKGGQFEDMIDLIRKCLDTNPMSRITVKMALQSKFFGLK